MLKPGAHVNIKIYDANNGGIECSTVIDVTSRTSLEKIRKTEIICIH